jgi:hypothetical protein
MQMPDKSTREPSLLYWIKISLNIFNFYKTVLIIIINKKITAMKRKSIRSEHVSKEIEKL